MCYPQIRNNVHLSLKPFRTAKAAEKAAGKGNHLLRICLGVSQHPQLSRAGCSAEHRPGKTCSPRPPSQRVCSRQDSTGPGCRHGAALRALSFLQRTWVRLPAPRRQLKPPIGSRESNVLFGPQRTPDVQVHMCMSAKTLIHINIPKCFYKDDKLQQLSTKDIVFSFLRTLVPLHTFCV